MGFARAAVRRTVLEPEAQALRACSPLAAVAAAAAASPAAAAAPAPALAVRRGGRSSRSRGGASFARSISSSGGTRLPFSCFATSLRPIRPRVLVDLLDDHVEHVAALDHVLDVADAARADVRDVQQAVGALLQLDERAEVGRLDDLAGVLVADLRGPWSAPRSRRSRRRPSRPRWRR